MTTNPAGLTGVAVTYNGSTTAPTAAGSYEVVATLTNANYAAAPITGSMVIAKATANVTLADLEHTYNGNTKFATATTDASGTSIFTFTYDGSTEQPINYKAGGYEVVATLVNENYSGSASGRLIIQKADQIISWATPSSITYGTALSVTQLNASASEGAALTYTPAEGTVLHAGQAQTLSVTAAETNNYKSATAAVQIDVAKATPAVALLVGGPYTYDGSPKLVSSASVIGVGGASLGEATVIYKKEGVSVEAPVNAGEYEVLASFAGNNNYEVATATGTLVIQKAQAEIVLGTSRYTYDGTAKSVVVTTSPEGLAGLEVTNNNHINANSYPVTASLNNENYKAEDVNGILIIDKALLTIKAANAAKTYGDLIPEITASIVSGAVQGEVFNLTATTAATALSPVGAYTIEPAVTGVTINNYQVTAINGALTVSARPITVTADAEQSKVYGADEPAIYTYQITSGNLLEASHLGGALSRATGESVGTYAIIQGTLAATPNYALTYVGADFEITKRTVLVAADALSKVYGAADPEFTYTVASGSIIAGDQFSGKLERESGENAATYAVTLGTLSLGNNYNLSLTEGTVFTIMPKAITVTPLAGQNKVYGSHDPVFSYATSTDLVGSDVFSGALSRTSGENIGTYEIKKGTLSLNNNYNLDVVETVTFEITPKALTVSLTAEDKVYDGTVDAIATGKVAAADLVNGDVVIVTVSDATFNSKTAGNDKTVRATVSIDNANYSLSNSTATTTASITPKEITGAFAAANKVYDGTDAASITDRSLQGVIGQDDVTLIGGTATFSDKNVANGKPVTLTGATLSGLDQDNYKLSSVSNASADISPKAASVSPVASSKVYGTIDPAFSGTTDGFLESDGISVNYVRSPGEQVAGYAINGVLSPENALGNYDITYNTAVFEITKAKLVVVADNKSKVYGDVNPDFTGIMEGVVFTDEIVATYSSAATESSPVQTYPITISLDGAALSNYEIELTAGVLTITQRPIQITAQAQQKMFNQIDPTLTYSMTAGSLVGHDAITGELAREAGETAGIYAIGQGTLTAGSNYNLTFAGADFTIHAIPTVVILNPAPVQYGTKVDVVANYTGIVNNPAWVWGFTANTSGVQSATAITGSATVPSLPGVHKLVLQYKDAVGQTQTTDPVFISVYDPEGGFVTGGGWINSPMGALAGSDAIGKANFGFVAKYKKGKNEVEGNTEFQFQAGGVNFKSSTHNAGSLVIAGAKATYKGTGTIAGFAGTYNFMVVATDGQVNGGGGYDKFRIKIWNGVEVVYDNARGTDENAELGDVTILGGGSIVVHENKAVAANPGNGKKLQMEEQLEGLSVARFDNYPNAFSDRTTVRFAFEQDQNFALEVYDVRGSLIKKVATGKAEAGQVYEYELDARHLAEGVYFARLFTGTHAQTIKMILKK